MKTILIVDDESELVETMVRALSRYPREFSMITAANGAEAIAILEREHVDLISTDLNMPVLNGFHVLLYVLKHCPTTPILVVTAFDISTMHERISKRGFKSLTYLQKPFSLKYFIATVREQLSHDAQGHLEGISLFNILQLLQLEQKTCALRIYSTHGEGNLSFIEGELVHAWCNDFIGPEAVYSIMSWHDVRVEMRDAPIGTHRTLDIPLSQLLIEAVRRQDEAEATAGMETLDRNLAQTVAPAIPDDDTFTALAATTADAASLDDAGLFQSTEQAFLNGKDYDMSNVKQSLEEAMSIEGALGVALVDYQSGMALGTAGGNGSLNLEVAAAGNTEVIRSKLKVMSSLGLKDSIEDILITLGNQYHLIRLLKSTSGLFLYLVLSKTQANLAMSRHKLAQIETNLSV